MWALMRLKASSFHPYSWWALGLAFAISAAATTNVFALLGMIALVLAITLGAREPTPWARSISFYLVTALAVVVIRVIFRIVFNFDSQTNTAFALPMVSISLGELGSVELFGRVSWDALLGALRDGLRMAAIILSVGLANTLANPRRLLKNTPGALYEVASAWVIALNMAPQLIDSAKRVKQASRLRGRNQKRNVLGSLIIPVLEDTIERSLALAASMSARGFGRQGQLSQSQQIASRVLSLFGVTSLSIGAYLLLTMPSPWVGALLLSAGVLAVLATGRIASKRQIRTRYAAETWAIRDFAVLTAAALVACLPLLGVF
jgi:energy-coupling factor transport system permease protein